MKLEVKLVENERTFDVRVGDLTIGEITYDGDRDGGSCVSSTPEGGERKWCDTIGEALERVLEAEDYAYGNVEACRKVKIEEVPSPDAAR